MHYRSPEADLRGRTAVVTGANSGMGKETARELARMGAEVVLACRSVQRGATAADEIVDTTRNEAVHVVELDLASVASVETFAETFRARYGELDILVNNAAASLRKREVTSEGIERTWATNVLGPYLLALLLKEPLRASGRGRIVSVSTLAAGGLDLADTQYERRSYSGIGAYRASKQAGRMLCWHLAEQFADEAITVNALNPGYVASDLTRNAGGPLKALVTLTSFVANTPLDGADTAIWLAASPEVESTTGKFFSKRRETRCRFRVPEQIKAVSRLVEDQFKTRLTLAAEDARERR